MILFLGIFNQSLVEATKSLKEKKWEIYLHIFATIWWVKFVF